jgi:hypothetical protein
MKILNKYSWCPRRDSNGTSPEYKTDYYLLLLLLLLLVGWD